MVATRPDASESDLFLKLWQRHEITPAVARQVLKMGWPTEDRDRMHVLAVRNREGEITSDELTEMDRYLHASMILATLQSRARKVLRKKITRSRNRV